MVEGAWGAELRTSVSRVITTRSSCINERLGCFFIFFDVELSVRYSMIATVHMIPGTRDPVIGYYSVLGYYWCGVVQYPVLVL